MDSNIDAAVLGAGSWGTALAILLANNGHRVKLWARREAQAKEMADTRINERYLPGFELPENLRPTSDLKEALEGAQLVLSVVPTHGLRSVLETAADLLPPDAPVLSCTKGIEQGTLKMISGVFEEHLPADRHHLMTYLAGPSFAREVAANMPTAVTVAGSDDDVAHRVQHWLRNPYFRVYTTEDVVGAEVGGALKNIIAIAAGMGDGLGFGHNARAAVITRGLAEIGRLGAKLGAHPMTVYGLAGMGDLVLTCNGDLSRNRKVGLALGRGQKIGEILESMNMVAEGVKTTKSAYQLAQREGVDMPTTSMMYRILYEDLDPKEAVVELMGRPPRKERDDHA